MLNTDLKKRGFNMWCKICGYDVFVENGIILRAMKNNCTLPAHVYKKCKTGGWDKVENCKVNTFKSGVYRGNYCVM